MIDIEQLRPPKGSEAELVWLRGFEAGVMQMRADLHEQNRKLREALRVVLRSVSENEATHVTKGYWDARAALAEGETG